MLLQIKNWKEYIMSVTNMTVYYLHSNKILTIVFLHGGGAMNTV